MTNHPNRSQNVPVTNAEISFTMRDGRLVGRVTISDTTEAAINSLKTSSPVYNNGWHVTGVYSTETAAAIAAREYLGYDGPVWGIDSVLDDDAITEVLFGDRPKFDKKSNPTLVLRTLAI